MFWMRYTQLKFRSNSDQKMNNNPIGTRHKTSINAGRGECQANHNRSASVGNTATDKLKAGIAIPALAIELK